MTARQLLTYEEPSTTGVLPNHEYFEIVDPRPRTSENGQQISMPLYNRLNSLVPLEKKEMKIKRVKIVMAFTLGCILSASIMVPLIATLKEPRLIFNEENYNYCNNLFHTPCKNLGTCLMYNNTPVCVCKTGFVGHFCEIEDICISKHPCHHEGRCITTRNSSYCLCNDGYLGRHCEHRGPQGYHFLMAFNARHRNITLYINSDRKGTCDVTIPAEGSIPFKKLHLHGEYVSYSILNVRRLATTQDEDMTVRVVCEVPAYVFYFVTDSQGSIWASLPVQPIGTLSNYYVIPQYQPNQKFDALAVIAFSENTNVTINLENARWVLSNVTFEHQTYKQEAINIVADQNKYSYLSCHECHLTGTYANGTKPFALFYKTYIPEVNPVLPIKDFSNLFIVPTLPENMNALGYRIYSRHDNNIKIRDAHGSNTSLKLNADHFLVTNNKQTTVVSCDNDAILFLKIYSPHTGTVAPHIAGVNQYLPFYCFVVPANTNTNHLTFIVPYSDIRDIRLNGNPINNYRTTLEKIKLNATVTYLIFTVPVEIGWHKAENVNQNPFGLIVSGQSNAEDKKHVTVYAYFAGMSYGVE